MFLYLCTTCTYSNVPYNAVLWVGANILPLHIFYCKNRCRNVFQLKRNHCTIINPRRACAERVTVVVLCVCVCVCLSAHAILAVRAIKSATKDNVVLNVGFAEWRFS